MNDIEVKKEIEDIDNFDDCLPELTKLLEEVKREEVDEGVPTDVEEILKNVANDETESESDSADDADIQKLQELLKQKQKELKESEEMLKKKSRKKRKADDQEQSNRNEKKRKDNGDQGDMSSTILEQTHDSSLPSRDKTMDESFKMEHPSEKELENLLRFSDNSDEETCSLNHIGSAQSAEQVPCGSQPRPSSDFYNFCNSVSHIDAAPVIPTDEEDELQCLPVVNSAGFAGMPTFKRIKLERPASDKNETTVEPVDETPKEKRQRIFQTCMSILEQLEFTETSGKFIFTSTIDRSDSTTGCNSVLQNISNVHYEFQSIGPKLNISEWGLKAIGSANRKIAKAIGINAEMYFSKIKLKSDTLAGKLIKVEADGGEKNTTQQIDDDEPNLSTFTKSSGTQTEPLVCQKCAARSRIVGHDMGTQTRVYTSSFGTQTISTGNRNSDLSEGLNETQLKALYEFSHLIRGSSANSSLERFQARALDIYNILKNETKPPSSQDQRRAYIPNVPSYPLHTQHQTLQTQRIYSHERTNLRPIPPAGANHSTHMPTPPFHAPNQTVPLPPIRDPRQASMNTTQPTQTFHPSNHGIPHMPPRDPRHGSMNQSPTKNYWNSPPPDNFANYPPSGAPQTLRHPPSGSYPGHQAAPSRTYAYPPPAMESRAAYGRGHRL